MKFREDNEWNLSVTEFFPENEECSLKGTAKWRNNNKFEVLEVFPFTGGESVTETLDTLFLSKLGQTWIWLFEILYIFDQPVAF